MVTPAASLRIVFFGTPDFAVPTLQALHRSRHPVVGVVTQPDRARGRGQHSQPGPVKQLAERHGLRILQPERLRDEGFLGDVAVARGRSRVVAAYGKILTDAVLAIPRLGLINVHASLLPKYRGAAPIHRAVMAGETLTGVTIMRVVKALDAGPMISKRDAPDRRCTKRALRWSGTSRDIGAQSARRSGRRDRRRACVGDAAERDRGDLRAQDREGGRHHRLVAAGASTFTIRFAASIRGRTHILNFKESGPSCSDRKWNQSCRARAPCLAPCSTLVADRFRVQTGDGVLATADAAARGAAPSYRA